MMYHYLTAPRAGKTSLFHKLNNNFVIPCTMARNDSHPEYYIPIHLPSSDPIPIETDNSILKFPKSTHKDSYSYPKLKRPFVTREERFEQLIRHEIYNEYLRSIEQAENEPGQPRTSEYSGQYENMVNPEVNERQKKEMTNSISENPLYGSEAISYWNQKGKHPNNFKYAHRVTKPIALQDTQFG